MLCILLITLAIAPHIEPPIIIILGQRFYQIVHKENGVVVPENEPPHARLLVRKVNCLFDNTSYSYGGAETLRESERELGGVGGDYDAWQTGVAG